MGQISIDQDSYVSATIISNRFIDEYMTAANDAQLKIYLYLVRLMDAHLATDIADLAERFNYTENDVLRSLKYWAKKGLMELCTDEEGNLTGIRMKNLCAEDCQVPSVEKTHQRQELPKQVAPKKAVPVTEPEEAESETDLTEAFRKPAISAAQLRKIKDSGEVALPVSLAEAYLGRTLSPSDLRSIIFIKDTLGFSDDLIDYLLQYCVEEGHRDFRYIEKVAIAWKEREISTAEEAKSTPGRYDREVYEIMAHLGKSGSPTKKEVEFITRWREEYALPREVILEACDRTVLSTDSNRFKYADAILAAWAKQNVKSLKDVEEADKAHREKKPAAAPAGRAATPAAGKFNQFQTAPVDLKELERRIVSN